MRKIKLLILVAVLLFIPNLAMAEELDCTETLMKGNTGSSVKILQTMLNKVTNCNLDVDGSFGPLTYQCVTSFQKSSNLSQDGIVGKKTCNALNNAVSSITSTTTTKTTTTKSTTEDKDSVVVTGGTVNIRSSASKNGKILATVSLGNVLTVYGNKKVNNTTWYKVKVNNKYGYISSTYAKKDCILVDISEQTLTYYKNGSIYMTANVVTGTKGLHDTPTGSYTLSVANKEKGRTLKGKNDDGSSYASYVDYWMPFITSRGIGFHDADWRTSDEFTTDRYTYDGSHGCVNMQDKDAKKLYNAVTKDTSVVVAA